MNKSPPKLTTTGSSSYIYVRYAAIGLRVLSKTEIINCEKANRITTKNLFG